MALKKESISEGNRRRQRDYRARQQRNKLNLLGIARNSETLEDSIKLAANNGDDVAREIVAALPYPDVASLAAWFQGRARAARRPRSALRNAKKPANAIQ